MSGYEFLLPNNELPITVRSPIVTLRTLELPKLAHMNLRFPFVVGLSYVLGAIFTEIRSCLALALRKEKYMWK